MIYPVEVDLKKRMQDVGLSVRDVAVALNEVPSTTSARLNGYSQLSMEQRRVIERLIMDRENQNALR